MRQLSSQHANRGTCLVHAPPRQARARGAMCVEARAPRAGVGLLGTKVGMSTLWNKAGEAEPCTVIALESPNYVTQRFTEDRDGREAIQVRSVSCAQHCAACAPAAASSCACAPDALRTKLVMHESMR